MDLSSIGRRGNITLNAIISIISTAFRAALLTPVAQSVSQFCWVSFTRPRSLQDVVYYDSASRGPFGSLRLLFRLRFINFASIGAIITLTALALDPFFQQTVKYTTQSATDTSQQAKSVAAYTYGTGFEGAPEFVDGYTLLPYSMKTAVYQGLLSSNLISLADPPFNCPTGNCTWDPFSTLAVGSQCTDITSHIQLNCSATLCHFVAPEDSILQSLLVNTTEYNVFTIQSKVWTEYPMAALKPYANITGLLALVQWVKAIGSLSSPNYEIASITSNTTFEAVRCAFYLSVREVSVNVTNGVYSEDLLQENSHAGNVPGFFSNGTSSYSYGDDGREHWYPASITGPADISNGIEYHSINPFGDNNSLVYKPPFATTPPNLNDTFVVSYNAWFDLSSQLIEQGFLNGIVQTGSDDPLSGNDFPTLLYQASNVTRAMHSIAGYMTTQMRANDSLIPQEAQQNASLIAANQAVNGNVWVQKQFVTVRWAWLTLPALLLVLACGFLLAAFLKTRKSRVGLWQSSPLVFLFHARLADEAQIGEWKARELNTADQMQSAAEKLSMKITNSNDGPIEVFLNSAVPGRAKGKR
ncbi:hypothetical protein LARI1_G002287 [Lachnellula arida]|uniref:Uncharacterized protein n=1 Tax=Lachnellula arida TaxID=1316785 RepID=A0A8T9BNC8_9HELO|nr:hypothetical protein LARI1_G002287 [Lachnellula arida]